VLVEPPLDRSYTVFKEKIRLDAVNNALGFTRYPDYQEQLDYSVELARSLGGDAVIMYEDTTVTQYTIGTEPPVPVYAARVINYNN